MLVFTLNIYVDELAMMQIHQTASGL